MIAIMCDPSLACPSCRLAWNARPPSRERIDERSRVARSAAGEPVTCTHVLPTFDTRWTHVWHIFARYCAKNRKQNKTRFKCFSYTLLRARLPRQCPPVQRSGRIKRQRNIVFPVKSNGFNDEAWILTFISCRRRVVLL
jgi:hypothetical protein